MPPSMALTLTLAFGAHRGAAPAEDFKCAATERYPYMTFEYLDESLLGEVQDTAIELGFLSQGHAPGLTAGISRSFLAASAEGSTELVRLKTLTAKMNSTPVLTTGEVPLEKWLTNAIEMAGERSQELVFQRALEEVKRARRERRACCQRLEPGRDTRGQTCDNSGYRGVVMHTAWLSIQFLEDGRRVSESVALVCVPSFEQGQLSGAEIIGTGWLIAPDLLITAYRVINSRPGDRELAAQEDFACQALHTRVTFDRDGGDQAATAVGVTGVAEQNRELGYVILELEAGPGAPPLRLAADASASGRDSRATVNLIHPWAQPQMFALRGSGTTFVAEPAPGLPNPASADEGALGAPVFDDDWRVVAMHSATTEKTRAAPWGTSASWTESMTYIAAILEDLEPRSQEVWRFILDGQADPSLAWGDSAAGSRTRRLLESSDSLRGSARSIADAYQTGDSSWIWERRSLLSELEGLQQQLEAVGAWLESSALATPRLLDALSRYRPAKDHVVQRLGALGKPALATERLFRRWEFMQACESLIDLIRGIQEQLDSLGPGDHPPGRG